MITVIINTKKLLKNIKIISELCNQSGIRLIFCIKGLSGHQELLNRIFQNEGLPNIVADARKLHFKNNIDLFKNKTKLLISVPSYYNNQRIKDTLAYTNICYVSDIEHVRLLEKHCEKQKQAYSVIITLDSGDGREGISVKDKYHLSRICKFIKNSKHIKLIGLSTNIGCISNNVPSSDSLHFLSETTKYLEDFYKFNITYVIGGSSNALPLLQKKKLPSNINSLCVGEAIILGTIPGYRQDILNLQTEVCSIIVGICEVKMLDKDHYQCLLLIGKNDIDQSDIVWPEDIQFINYSSDYTVIRTNSKGIKKYNLSKGSVKINIKYYALPRLLSSAYAKICFIQ